MLHRATPPTACHLQIVVVVAGITVPGHCMSQGLSTQNSAEATVATTKVPRLEQVKRVPGIHVRVKRNKMEVATNRATSWIDKRSYVAASSDNLNIIASSTPVPMAPISMRLRSIAEATQLRGRDPAPNLPSVWGRATGSRSVPRSLLPQCVEHGRRNGCRKIIHWH